VLGVLVAEPGLEFGGRNLFSGSNPLDDGVVSFIEKQDCQPVGWLKVFTNVLGSD
jgi:hypothetical protein